MARSKIPYLGSQKGASAGIAIVAILIVVIVVVVFLGPGIFTGGGGLSSLGTIGSGSQGLIISSFSPDISVTEQKLPVIFSLILENRGERDATNVKARLIGLSQDWTYLIGPDFSGIPDKVFGADPSSGIPGDIITSDVEVEINEPRATEQTYTATAFVTYHYDTIFEGLVRVVNQEYERTSGVDSGIVSSKATSGPLSVSMQARSVSIRQGRSATVIIDVRDVGGGLAFGGSTLSSNPETSNKDRITLTTKGLTCSGVGSDNIIRLVNKQKVMTCTIPETDIDTFVDVPITINLEYNYYVTASTPVTVLKSLDSSEVGSGGSGGSSSVQTGIDLAVVRGSIGIGGADISNGIQTGDNVVISAKISNNRDTGASGPQYDVYLVRRSGNVRFTPCNDVKIDIGPRGEISITCPWIAGQAGTYDVFVEIGPDSNSGDNLEKGPTIIVEDEFLNE